MVEHFPPDRANQPFSICVLPWRSWRSWSVTNAHRTKPSDVCLAISAIAITNDVIRRSLPAASLRQLSSDPFSRRVCRYSQPHDSTSTVPENQKAIQQPERKCWHDKQVHRSDAVSVIAKKGPPACDGPRLPRAMYFATLVWPTSMPSLSSSPWMRGAPQSRLARLMSRINLRTSSGTLGLPPRRLHFQRQNDRNPARCQRTTVSGRTMDSASTMPGTRRYSSTNTNRSKVPKPNLFGEVRRSTLICCRRTRISASSLLLSETSWSPQTTAGREHRPSGMSINRFAPVRQPYSVSHKDSRQNHPAPNACSTRRRVDSRTKALARSG